MSVLPSDLFPHDLKVASTAPALTQQWPDSEKYELTVFCPFQKQGKLAQKFPIFAFTFHKQGCMQLVPLSKLNTAKEKGITRIALT